MKGIHISNEFATLGSNFYTPIDAEQKTKPQLLLKNQELIAEFSITLNNAELTELLSGNTILEYTQSVASVYAGHQFGSFNPQLGDGRALLLGNIRNSKQELYELGLKGSGVTPYSRRGDGLLAIGPALREYLVSEYMHALGIATTRSLAIVISADSVWREAEYQSAVLTRISRSFVRIGTFEYFFSQRKYEEMRTLADYMITHYFPEVKARDYVEFFARICSRQAHLIAQWQALGFIHGVMNTDNMSIVGETIDYGPCAFMDDFQHNKVFSSIDTQGRYAFHNQAAIARWNLTSLANCLLSLYEDKQVIADFERILSRFMEEFRTAYFQRMADKLAISVDRDYITQLLMLLEQYHIDYTEFFYNLPLKTIEELTHHYQAGEDWIRWYKLWQQKRSSDYKKIMQQHNPYIIPRNHQIERAIQQANNGDFDYFFALHNALKTPFVCNEHTQVFSQPPRAEERVAQTFCGT